MVLGYPHRQGSHHPFKKIKIPLYWRKITPPQHIHTDKKDTTIVTLLMVPYCLYSDIFYCQLVQICLENVFHRLADLKITVSGGDFVIFLAYILCLPIFRELCWLYGYKISTFYPSLLMSQNTARKKGWEPHLKVPFPIEIDKVGCGVTSSPCGPQLC